MEQTRRLHVYPHVEAMQSDVVSRATSLANECINKRGAFHIVLAGGSTPQAIYRELKEIRTDWNAWHIYFGDERCLPVGDPERNDSMALTAWLAEVPIPLDQILAIPAELGAESGARIYEAVVAKVDCFDLVLLGLGEDGHTASLFPDQLHDQAVSVVAVHDAPKAPSERISLSAGTLSKGNHVWFLVSGENKRETLSRWQRGAMIPASTIRPESGVDIFTDIDLED